jgi:replicative DNA helicase
MGQWSEIRPAPVIREDAPFNIEAEQQLLGAILNNNAFLDRVSDILKADHFFEPLHGRIYQIACDRIAKAHLVSPVVLKSLMEGDEGLQSVGGPSYLARMSGAACGSYAVRDYAELVVANHARRKLAEAATGVVSDLRTGGDLGEASGRLLTAIQMLPQGAQESSISATLALTRAVQEIEALRQGTNAMLKTGIPALDGILKGLAPGDLFLLAGSTSMGKTATALEITANIAMGGKPVLYVSLEMMPEQLVARLASAKSGVPYTDLREPEKVEHEDYRRFIQSCADVSMHAALRIAPRHIRDAGSLYAAAMRARSDMGGLSLVVVDYAGLMRAPGKDRYNQMTEVSVSLKSMAGMLGVPFLVLCQINRESANRDDKRPQLTDLRESGQFEQDADQVVFCHREEYWLERQGPKPDKSGAINDGARADYEVAVTQARNKMELIVRKNRHGRLGTALVGFHAPTNKFWRLEGQA